MDKLGATTCLTLVALSLLSACYDVPPSVRSADRSTTTRTSAGPANEETRPDLQIDDTPPATDDGPADIRGVTYTPSDRRPPAGSWAFGPHPAAWSRWQSGTDDMLGDLTLLQVRTDGVSVSQAQTDDGTTFSVPNALLVPIPRIPTIALGDVVLVPRERQAVPAVVMSLTGSNVTLNDLRQNQPVGERMFEAPRHLVLPLEERGAGMWILCADREATRMYQLMDDNGDNLLVLDSYRAITVRRRSRCAPVEPEPMVRENTDVLAWVYGALRRAQVQSVFADEARARVAFNLAGRPQSADLPLYHIVIGAPEVGRWDDDADGTEVIDTHVPPAQ